ncbi:MAG: hypothetical protein ACREXU_02580 [Gammaproteobacteria bacterium]
MTTIQLYGRRGFELSGNKWGSAQPAGCPRPGRRSFYPGGAPPEEVRITHPLAAVEAVEDSRVSGA